jgi:hypothetical protein
VVASGGVFASPGQEVLESGSVESSTLNRQEVAGRLGDHDGAAAAFSERLAQPGDEDAERAGGPFLGFFAPEVLHQALNWNDPVGGQQEQDKDGPLAAPGKGHRPPLRGDLKRTKDAEFHRAAPLPLRCGVDTSAYVHPRR